MIRSIITALALTLVGVIGVTAPAEATRTEYMPCSGNDTERNCVWDQRHGGEGDGFSFSFFVNRNGVVYRLPHHMAHRLIYGE